MRGWNQRSRKAKAYLGMYIPFIITIAIIVSYTISGVDETIPGDVGGSTSSAQNHESNDGSCSVTLKVKIIDRGVSLDKCLIHLV